MNAAIQNETTGACPQARNYCDISIMLPVDFRLQSGEALSRPELRLRVYGDTEKPAIAVSGGISSGRAVAATPDSAGEMGHSGWWRDIVRQGGPVDLDDYCVIGFDFLPGHDEIARTIGTADQARALANALDIVNIERLHAFIGASYGGLVALAFAAAFPSRRERRCVISAAERAHPAATAIRGVQRRIVDFAAQCGDPQEGVALARQLAMITYRTPEEFEARFDHAPGTARGEPSDVCNYLISRGRAFGMDAERYLTLSDSIDRHHVDPAEIKAASLFIAVRSDRLVPLSDMRRLAGAVRAARLVEIDSLYGHDAFLKEADRIGPVITAFIQEQHA